MLRLDDAEVPEPWPVCEACIGKTYNSWYGEGGTQFPVGKKISTLLRFTFRGDLDFRRVIDISPCKSEWWERKSWSGSVGEKLCRTEVEIMPVVSSAIVSNSYKDSSSVTGGHSRLNAENSRDNCGEPGTSTVLHGQESPCAVVSTGFWRSVLLRLCRGALWGAVCGTY